MSNTDPYRERILERPWAIIGSGYTGTRLARRLVAAGAETWVTRRSTSDAEGLALTLGARGRGLDLENHEHVHDLDQWLPPGANLVHCAPPGRRGPEGERDLVRAARRAQVARLVYVSSTGVYPRGDGTWLDEDSPVGPESGLGRARLASETAVLHESQAVGLSAVSLRVVGIYGPGRGVHTRLLAGNYRVIGAGDTYVNRVHVDDLVTCIIAAATAPKLPRHVYHVADDRPERARVYADAVATVLGTPNPPSVPASEVAPWVASMLSANRRICNARIKRELGVELCYPTWREGLVQALAEDGIPMKASMPEIGAPNS